MSCFLTIIFYSMSNDFYFFKFIQTALFSVINLFFVNKLMCRVSMQVYVVISNILFILDSERSKEYINFEIMFFFYFSRNTFR